MRNIIIGSAISMLLFAACNNGNNKSISENTTSNDTTQAEAMDNKETTSPNGVDGNSHATVTEIVAGYLQVKNALASDNGKDAATGGNAIVKAIGKFDKSALTADQKKAYDDVADDTKEMAEHISKNAGKIAHQREHFDMLSKDMYDLVKTFGAGQPLYQDFCPMYNDKKGATWLSETKEIKNPYLGKKMLTCGTVKEEIK